MDFRTSIVSSPNNPTVADVRRAILNHEAVNIECQGAYNGKLEIRPNMLCGREPKSFTFNGYTNILGGRLRVYIKCHIDMATGTGHVQTEDDPDEAYDDAPLVQVVRLG